MQTHPTTLTLQRNASMTIYSSEKPLPYVYKLTHKKTKQFYIGSRYTKFLKLPSHLDILKYQTSSKKVKSLGFQNFDIEIIAEFFSAESAWDFEQQLINENYKNPLILNSHRHSPQGLRFIFRAHTKENKQRLRELHKGKRLSIEHRKKLRESHQRLRHQQGQNNSQYGKRFKFINNGQIQRKVEISEIPDQLARGWTLGRLPQVNRCLQYKKKQ
jgi:hypothetical protein